MRLNSFLNFWQTLNSRLLINIYTHSTHLYIHLCTVWQIWHTKLSKNMMGLALYQAPCPQQAAKTASFRFLPQFNLEFITHLRDISVFGDYVQFYIAIRTKYTKNSNSRYLLSAVTVRISSFLSNGSKKQYVVEN